jgi:dTDP-4-dehydrorhamnose 3,5-epimerase
MQIFDTALPEVKIVAPKRAGDTWGFFSEVWNGRDFAAAGIAPDFAQDNHSRNPLKATLHGLHSQVPPAAQGKLLRVAHGSIFDVAVDIKRGSPTFRGHADAMLSADKQRDLFEYRS